MAGAGYKLFNTGDVLTAAQVNTYLQEQVVMVFANATARTTALSGVLAEGMVSFLKDTDSLEIYSGSAWVAYGSGDITGITTGATSGLTGGVTSGTADLKFNTTAKGGLLVGTGSGTVSELAVGSNTQVLTADSTTATGLKWAAAASGGKILQVVQDSSTTQESTTSESYVDTDLSISITPSSASSTILVVAQISGNVTKSSTTEAESLFNIVRTSTEIGSARLRLTAASANLSLSSSIALIKLDSPATTSSVTYKVQFKSNGASTTTYKSISSTLSSLTLIEVGA